MEKLFINLIGCLVVVGTIKLSFDLLVFVVNTAAK